MTYTPVSDSDLVAPVAGSSTAWPALIANDAACFELYTPGLEANHWSTSSSAAREFRWREYGGMDAPLVASCLVVGVRAAASSGPQTITIATPGIDSDTVAVNGDAWYTAQVDAAGPMQEVIVSCTAPGAGDLVISGIRSHRTYSTGAAGTLYPSGWRKIGTVWGTSGYPIPSEVQGRLATNPSRLARDRPVCVAAHIGDCIKAVSGKSEDVWGIEFAGTTNWQRLGRLAVPRCDTKPRLFRVDAYTTETLPRVTTQIAAASAGQPVTDATITVGSTTGFAASGYVWIRTTDGVVASVDYSGVTATAFTGCNCSNSTSTMALGDSVVQGGADYSVKIGSGNDEQWNGPGWHSWQVELGPQRHDVWATVLVGPDSAAAIRTLTVWRTEL